MITSSSFTISDQPASQKMVKYLTEMGFWAAASWNMTKKDKVAASTFHFDVVVTPGDEQSEFSWTTSQFDRVRFHTACAIFLQYRSSNMALTNPI